MARKRPISEAVRRGVAARYGVLPGTVKRVRCAYCDFVGEVQWFLSSHRPGLGRVALEGLEFDHVIAESMAGISAPSNIMLACRSCNRSKGSKRLTAWKPTLKSEVK
jgi:5-methylcytosine-specific restriction endonuclease McrA